MELKVWVEGIQRIVCGVTETTTCQDVVFALAHATGKSGRFTLIERWRCNERLLAPHEQPLKILSKWGEYSSDVQFILQWSESNKAGSPTQQQQFIPTSKLKTAIGGNTPPIRVETGKSNSIDSGLSESKTNSEQEMITTSPKKAGHLMNSTENMIRREVPPYKEPPNPPVVAPPPYRDPPPPISTTSPNNNIVKHTQKKYTNKDVTRPPVDENSFYNSQYKELIQLVNYQREKISLQQADLTKYDAEIVFWESKGREQQSRLDLIAQELVKVNNISRMNCDKMKALNYIEEEHEIVRQQEKTLMSEITLLRSKLANCETELLQCKNKIRLLMDEVQLEKRAQLRLGESQLQLERCLMTEIDRLNHELELANQDTERNQNTAEILKREVAILETAIVDKKKEVESLVNEMKEANLLSLSIASAEEVRHLLEGPTTKAGGSTRKIIGSPRQLENAVPTNKNPHGVWV